MGVSNQIFFSNPLNSKLTSFLLYLLFFCFVFLGIPSKLLGYTFSPKDSSLQFKAYQFKRLPTNGKFHSFSAQLDWPDSIRVSFDVKSIDIAIISIGIINNINNINAKEKLKKRFINIP